MREERKNFLEVEQADLHNARNGYYHRSLDTKYGKIENLSVPRDRNGDFQTQFFEPYQRRDSWLEQAIIKMYQSGMSTREVGKFIERTLGTQYSLTTISNITNATIEDIISWQKRPLHQRYSVLYINALYIKLKREIVAKEAIYIVLGIHEEGYREILSFYVGGQESSIGWKEVLEDLYENLIYRATKKEEA
jgi:putative transposase